MSSAFVRVLKMFYAPLFHCAAHQILKGRLFDQENPKRGRWLASDINAYLRQVWERVDALMPVADLEALPNYGNRHNVFLSVVTAAAYQRMIERNVTSSYAKTLVSDVGWKIYSWMLGVVSLPFRVLISNPGRRIKYTLKILMFFPFSSPGPPGYESKVWTEGSNTCTHWTHCPPQTFIRRLVKTYGDRGELDAFYESWCLYDWPGADIIAGDGRHGHYSRHHTLSRGDALCDMCWQGAPNPVPKPEK
jgi:hypothetical protein